MYVRIEQFAREETETLRAYVGCWGLVSRQVLCRLVPNRRRNHHPGGDPYARAVPGHSARQRPVRSGPC